MSPDAGTGSTLRRRAKTLLGRGLYATGLHRRVLGDRAVIAVFHRVRDDLPPNPITCSPAELAAYLDFFQRHFDVVALDELLDRLEGGTPIRGCLAITFDDGYSDNHAVAAPELERRGLPATFFIATGFIGTRRVPWWDASWGIASEWMSWDDVRDLGARGFTLGAHTVNHVDLGQVHGETAAHEIAESKTVLERETGLPVTTFSYPYGRPEQMTDANRELVRAAGLRCAPSAHGGLVRPGDDPFRLRRSPISTWHLTPAQWGFEILRD